MVVLLFLKIYEIELSLSEIKMKNIKFKVWDYDTKTMYTQEQVIISFNGLIRMVSVCEHGIVKPLCNYELLQYTGIDDVEGNEIYDKDIVEMLNDISGYATIDDKGNLVKVSNNLRNAPVIDTGVVEMEDGFWQVDGYSLCAYKLRVIGNACENNTY